MAAFPSSRYPATAETYEQIKESWSAKVIEAVKNNLVCVGAFDTTWKSELAKGDILHIPVGSSLTAYAVDVTSDYGGGINTDWGATAETITVDSWYACPVQVDDGTAAQTQITDIVNRLSVRAAYEINAVIDRDVNALYSSLTSTWAGSDGQDFTDDLCIELMEGLDEAGVPRQGRKHITDPSGIADMYKIDKFINRDYNRTLSGEMGSTPYGDPILVTNNLTASTTGAGAMYAHTSAIGIVIQSRFPTDVYPWKERYSHVIDSQAIWGCDVVRSTFGAYYYTRKK